MSTGSSPQDTAGVAAAVRDARSSRMPTRIVGGGLWLDAGRPVPAPATLSLGAMSGVTSFEPDDFTLTARAATPLAEIARVTAQANRWLTLDPHGSRDGTIGATVATASWGPLASAFGTPRDHVLGCEVVTGIGEVVRAGGRVVKNVAGFDLVRLMTGSWGTLGIITEVTVRLRARPEVERTLAVPLDGDEPRRCDDAVRWLHSIPFRPLAAELCSPTMAQRLGLERRTTLLVRLGGNEPLVRAAGAAVAELGDGEEVGDEIWDRLRDVEPEGATVVRLGELPTSLGALWSAAGRAVTSAGGWVHATLARGVVRCILPPPQSPEENENLGGIMKALPTAGSRIVERLPATLWTEVPSAAADALSSTVRRTFDPDGVLNPGILDPSA